MVLPESADEVSQVVQTLSAGMHVWEDQCQYAIQSAGYVEGHRDAAKLSSDIVLDTRLLLVRQTSKMA